MAVVSLEPWQELLDRHRELFDHLGSQARLGIAGLEDDTMIVCHSIDGGGWRASAQRFPGVGQAAVDLLVVLDQRVARKMVDGGYDDLLPVLRREIRLGRAICFCRSSHETLIARGFSEVMKELGMAEMARSH